MRTELSGTTGTAIEEWFVEVSDRELDRAYRLAGLILGNFSDAEDATHDAFVRAWAGLASLRDRDAFSPWFDRILVNVCRDRLRRQRLVKFVDVDAEVAIPLVPEYDGRVGDAQDLLDALRRLPRDLRIVIVLRYWADLTVDDIAARIGSPTGTVKSRLYRAIQQLRNHLLDDAAIESAR